MTWRGALAYRSADLGDLALTDEDQDTRITFDEVVHNGAGAFDLTANAGRAVIRSTPPGKVRVTAGAYLTGSASASTSDYRRLTLKKNGSVVRGAGAVQCSAHPGKISLTTAPLVVSPDDYFELYARHAVTGTNDLVVKGDAGGTYLAIEELPADLKCCMVKLTADETVGASGTTLYVPWDAEEYDTDGFWAAGSATRLTIPSGVDFVRITGSVRWWNASSDSRMVFLRKNGGSNGGPHIAPAMLFHGMRDTGASVGASEWFQTPWLSVMAGDYFELGVFGAWTGTASLIAHEETFFAIESIPSIETEIATTPLATADDDGVVFSPLHSPIALPVGSPALTKHRKRA